MFIIIIILFLYLFIYFGWGGRQGHYVRVGLIHNKGTRKLNNANTALTGTYNAQELPIRTTSSQ